MIPQIVLNSRKPLALAPPVEPILCYKLAVSDQERTFTPEPVFTPGADDAAFAEAQKRKRVTGGDVALGIVVFIIWFIVMAAMAGCTVKMSQSQSSGPAAYGMLLALFGGSVGAARIIQGILDKRPPVVLLRAHADDAAMIHKGLFDFERLGRRQFGDNATEIAFEEVLYDEVRFYGPTFALSPQDSNKLALDHGRNYRFQHGTCPLDEWQKIILYKIAAARLVVVVLGSAWSLSDKRWGLAWEIATLRAVNCPSKVMLVVPPCSPEERVDRWTEFRKLSGEIGIKAPESLADDVRILVFTPDWECVVSARGGTTLAAIKDAVYWSIDDQDNFRSRIRRAVVGAVLGSGITIAIIMNMSQQVPFMTAALITLVAGFILGSLFFLPRSVW
jgi:hypothetical protein